jgi:hypothetical protein
MQNLWMFGQEICHSRQCCGCRLRPGNNQRAGVITKLSRRKFLRWISKRQLS